MNDLTSTKKPLNISILNTIIESTVQSNATSGFNRQNQHLSHPLNLANYSFKDTTIRSYRNQNVTLNNVNKANQLDYSSFNKAQSILIQNENKNNIESKVKQKFKFKMKFFRKKSSIKDYIPCLCLWFLLITLSAIYFGLVWPRVIEIFNTNSYWIIFLAFKVYFFVNLVVNFLFSIFRDPGRLPMETADRGVPHKSELTVEVKGEPVEQKWCTVCKI